MTTTPPINRIRTSGPYHGGLWRTFFGIGAVYRPLSSGDLYRPTFEVARPDADFPFFEAPPGPFVLVAIEVRD
jgi:hypothetical protein